MKKSLGARLKELRGDLSQVDFCFKIKQKQGTYSAWERDEKDPASSAIALICTECAISSDWLLGLSDQRGPPKQANPQTSAAVEASVEPKHHKPTCSPCPTCAAKDTVIADLSAVLREVSKGTGFPVRAHSSTKAPAPF
jgi:hypothetical protein